MVHALLDLLFSLLRIRSGSRLHSLAPAGRKLDGLLPVRLRSTSGASNSERLY